MNQVIQNSYDIQNAIALLEASGHYQVLTKISAERVFTPRPVAAAVTEAFAEIRTGVVLDTETTGVTIEDEIIQLSMIKFTYDALSGQVISVIGRYNAYHEPKKPISQEITDLTHITNEMVAGQRIDEYEAGEFIIDADLIIAHNAKFDRGMLENNVLKFIPGYEAQAWACSQVEVDWKSYGASNAKLEYLLFKAGYSYEAHRADVDCEALLHLLDTPMKNDEGDFVRPLMELHASAIQKSYKVWAIGAPYDAKDLLKARGYVWSDGSTDHKAWYIVTDEASHQAEKDFLESVVFKRKMNLTVEVFDATTRYQDPAAKRAAAPAPGM